ncbi:hypothetical protein ABT011_35725, partial [Streptomyces virginiae]
SLRAQGDGGLDHSALLRAVERLSGASWPGRPAAFLEVLPMLARTRGSFLYWSRCTTEKLLADLDAPTDLAAHVVHLARIARRKYRGLRLAGDITGGSLVTLAAALLTSLI